MGNPIGVLLLVLFGCIIVWQGKGLLRDVLKRKKLQAKKEEEAKREEEKKYTNDDS